MVLRRFLSLTFLFFLTAFHLPDHALYIGVIKIEHQEGSTLSNLSIKVFSDDLHNALKNEFDWKELPTISVACGIHSAALQQYFENHLTIWINNEPVSLELQTCENNSEVYILNYTFSPPSKWQTLTLQADFLMELYPTQSNVLQVQYKANNVQEFQSYFGRMVKGKEKISVL